MSGADEGLEVSADIPLPHVAIAFGVIILQSLVSHELDLGNAAQLLLAGTRAAVQLICLGGILYPIFTTQHPALVFGYIFGFMILISAYEAAARPKVVYPGIIRHAAISLGTALFLNLSVVLAIIRPTPWYNAQYLIPIAGMLINNALNGTALALNQMLDQLVNQKEHLEVLLAFGATPWEAAWHGFVKSCQAAMIPAINGMNVLGLVSIPGMMTGQILGGASPMKAAKYQIIITFLISGTSFTAVVVIASLTILVFFDSRGRHDMRHVVPQTRVNVGQFLERKVLRSQPKPKAAAKPSGNREPLLAGEEAGAAVAPLELRLEPLARPVAVQGGEKLLELDVEGLVGGRRPLRAQLRVNAGEVACILGPSGVGKSTLLKWVCDLVEARQAAASVKGESRADMSAQAWRREVLYVHQSKAPLPGRPRDLLNTVQKLRVNRQCPEFDPVPALEKLGLSADFLDRPWNELSGGEAQRTMCSIALSTQPACLLLDEPSSALDAASKLLFEDLLRGLTKSAVVLVTHDEQQAQRLATSVWRVAER